MPQCRMAVDTVLGPRTAPPCTWLLTLFSHSVCSAEHTKYCTSAMCACRFIPAEITCATPPLAVPNYRAVPCRAVLLLCWATWTATIAIVPRRQS